MSRFDDCDRIRPLLANLVDATPADVGPATRDAIRAHVARCRACDSALAELVLIDYAVRRALAPAASMEPPADAWPRLRARVTRRSPGRAFAGSSLAGLLVGAAVAVMLVVPFAVPKPTPKVTQEIGLEVIVTSGAEAPEPVALSSDAEDLADARWLMENLQARHDATLPGTVVTPRNLLIPYAELSEADAAVPQSNLPRIHLE